MVQGESMNDDEIRAFETEPEHDAAVQLRRADEAAKAHGRVVDPLADWQPVLEQVAAHVGSAG